MSQSTAHPTPTEISLHRKSRMLSIAFSDGRRFELPCEYLRVFSKAAEVRAMRQPVVGKEEVNIERIEPQGQYALRLIFDDGHDTGIYSWETLYALGANQEKNWQEYMQKLQDMGYTRQTPEAEAGKRKIKLLYFSYLVQKLRKDHEEVELPETVSDVQGLLEWLRKKQYEKGYLLADDAVRVTVNRQFCEPFTKLHEGDEVGIVPSSPIAPAPPR
jgi:DUF971 family protein/molybdopterin converting factor small subunit